MAYDTLYPAHDRLHFFVNIAGTSPLNILEVGCGTGHLARMFAHEGHKVTGVDPSPVMLDVARSQPGSEAVLWVESNASGLKLHDRFDLITMTGHVFQAFLEDDDVCAVLANLRDHLAPGARLCFETRNPSARIWEQWDPEEPRRCLIPDLGVVESHRVVEAVDGEFVTYKHHLRFGDDEQISTNVMRFWPQDKIHNFVETAGFRGVVYYGDWDRTPVTQSSPELIVIASLAHEV